MPLNIPTSFCKCHLQKDISTLKSGGDVTLNAMAAAQESLSLSLTLSQINNGYINARDGIGKLFGLYPSQNSFSKFLYLLTIVRLFREFC